MVWSSSAQGIRPYAPQTRQPVCKLVTPSPRKPVFCPFCFQSLTHSFVLCKITSPFFSCDSALFAKNMGGGYTPQNLRRVFKHLQTLRFSNGGYIHPLPFCPPPDLRSVPLCLCGYPYPPLASRRSPVAQRRKTPLISILFISLPDFFSYNEGGIRIPPSPYQGPACPDREIRLDAGVLLRSRIIGYTTRDTCSSAGTSRHFASFRRYFRPVVV